MPIVRKANGWYWGSKGPFRTREQALNVMRAAFAQGYRPRTRR